MNRRVFLKSIAAGGLGLVLSSAGTLAQATPMPQRRSPHYRGISVVTVSSSGRITIPKRFKLSFPFYIVRLTARDESRWLAIAERWALRQLQADYGKHCLVLSEHHTLRPTLPQPIREQFSLSPGSEAAVIGIGNVIELCSHEAFICTVVKTARAQSMR